MDLIEMPKYLYIMQNNDWRGKYKYGFSTILKNRICSSHEQHSSLTNYKNIFQLKQIPHKYKLHKEFDKLFSVVLRRPNFVVDLNKKYGFSEDIQHTQLQKIKEYLVNENGGKEFIKQEGMESLIRFIKNGFEMFGIKLVKSFSKEEIDQINENRKREYQKKQDEEKQLFDAIFDKPAPPPKKLEPYKWNPRDYQIEIIRESIKRLESDNKIYIELATGGGKSYIVFKILQHFRPKTIIIFSPRKKINQQNMDQKYLDLLEDKYETFNCSTDGNISKFLEKPVNKIIVCCSQSSKKLYESINRTEIKDIMVWYDEAHWGFEEWFSESNKIYYSKDIKGNSVEFKKFWIEDTSRISKKIFVSASPNKEILRKNKEIFGEIYHSIKVKNLMQLKYLCKIRAQIFEENLKKERVNIIDNIIDSFKSNDKNWGFSFHNSQKSAFYLFYKHYEMYKKGKTENKPFLLISEQYELLSDKDVEKDEELKDIREKCKRIELDYDYINEKVYQENQFSIAYVVKKFSMGYDFDGIDYIIFTDKKTAFKDIIQSIGRGLRILKDDTIKKFNIQKEKELLINLPVFFEDCEEEEKYEYQKLEEVIRYLMIDLDLKWKDIFREKEDKKPDNMEKKTQKGPDYLGSEKVRQRILDIINRIKVLTSYPKFVELLQDYNIYGSVEYSRFRKHNTNLGLPKHPHSKFRTQNFCWYNILKEEEKEKYYSSKECINRIIEIRDELHREKNKYLKLERKFDKKTKFLNEKDKKIPNRNLWDFYGLEQKQFIVF